MTNPGPRILVLYAHSAPHRSQVNQRMADAIAGLPNVTLNDLYETYPDFHFDVAREQTLLAAADLLVFQHPIQWYSMPALMKEWVDLVLEHGWAYGPGGTALQGKDYWLVTTAVRVDASYCESDQDRHAFPAFLPPFEMTARLCGMRLWSCMAPLALLRPDGPGRADHRTRDLRRGRADGS